ncbi:MAG TPA: CFI-box-CTERM domain-containing protein [Nitrosopumilus sp.]
MVGSAYAQTPFRDTAGLTLNGIEWCEENYQLYYFIGNDFFEHHRHSIESRLCGNLYNDDLWLYSEPDRYQKLIEASRMYYSLEIQESAEEAEEGKIDTKPVNIKEIPQEIAQQQKESDKLIAEEVKENNIEIKTVCDEGAELIDGMCWIVETTEGGGCLIATATYGSEMAPQVQFLREIRDNQLVNTQSGSLFMAGFNQVYYSFSPYVADIERESPLFKEFVKVGITPLLSTLSVMSHAESESQVFGYGIGVILMNVGMYFAIPTMLIVKLKRAKFRKLKII